VGKAERAHQRLFKILPQFGVHLWIGAGNASMCNRKRA
jgi:hypothetical protein